MNERKGWYWIVRASRGPVGRQENFFEKTVEDIEGIKGIFKEFLKQERQHKQDGPFHLEVFHCYGQAVNQLATYQVDFSRGCELWEGHKPIETINRAWEQAGGIVR